MHMRCRRSRRRVWPVLRTWPWAGTWRACSGWSTPRGRCAPAVLLRGAAGRCLPRTARGSGHDDRCPAPASTPATASGGPAGTSHASAQRPPAAAVVASRGRAAPGRGGAGGAGPRHRAGEPPGRDRRSPGPTRTQRSTSLSGSDLAGREADGAGNPDGHGSAVLTASLDSREQPADLVRTGQVQPAGAAAAAARAGAVVAAGGPADAEHGGAGGVGVGVGVGVVQLDLSGGHHADRVRQSARAATA